MPGGIDFVPRDIRLAPGNGPVRWSPDSSRLVAYGTIVGRDGRLIGTVADTGIAAWSWDSHHLAVAGPASSRVSVVDADGSHRQEIGAPIRCGGRPARLGPVERVSEARASAGAPEGPARSGPRMRRQGSRARDRRRGARRVRSRLHAANSSQVTKPSLHRPGDREGLSGNAAGQLDQPPEQREHAGHADRDRDEPDRRSSPDTLLSAILRPMARKLSRKVPLAELHCHLGGAVTPAIMWSIAHAQGIKLPTRDYWEFRDTITVSPTRARSFDGYLQLFHWTELIQSLADRRRAGRLRGRRRRLPQEQRHDDGAPLQPDEAEPRRRAGPRPHHRGGGPRHGPGDCSSTR